MGSDPKFQKQKRRFGTLNELAILKTLIETKGSRTTTAHRLHLNDINFTNWLKRLKQLPERKLSIYADLLSEESGKKITTDILETILYQAKNKKLLRFKLEALDKKVKRKPRKATGKVNRFKAIRSGTSLFKRIKRIKFRPKI
ncbi:MAG: hypothetical protein ABIH00_02315 [Armatimonadota bacterium]